MPQSTSSHLRNRLKWIIVIFYRALFILVMGIMLTESDYLPGKVVETVRSTCPGFKCKGLEKLGVWRSIFFAFCHIIIAGYGFYALLRDIFRPTAAHHARRKDRVVKEANTTIPGSRSDELPKAYLVDIYGAGEDITRLRPTTAGFRW